LLVSGLVSVLVSTLALGSLAWLTALGIACLILGFVVLALAYSLPDVSPQVGRLLLEAGLDNLSSLVEELGISTRPIYLPSRLGGGRPLALIPLHDNPSPPRIGQGLPRRFIVRYGGGPDEVGLLVATAGTVAVEMLETPPGPSVPEIEAALAALLVGRLGAAAGVTVNETDGGLYVSIRQPRFWGEESPTRPPLDSPLASVAAAVVAEARGLPFRVVAEERDRRAHTVRLEAAG